MTEQTPTYLALTQEQLDQLLEKAHVLAGYPVEHRAFVQLLIEDRANRRVLWQKFQASLIGGAALAILGVLGWIGTLVLEGVRHVK